PPPCPGRPPRFPTRRSSDRPEGAVHVRSAEAAREVYALGQVELDGALDDPREHIPRPHDHEAHPRHDVGHAARHLDEMIRSLLADRKSTRLNSSHEWISYAV